MKLFRNSFLSLLISLCSLEVVSVSILMSMRIVVTILISWLVLPVATVPWSVGRCVVLVVTLTLVMGWLVMGWLVMSMRIRIPLLTIQTVLSHVVSIGVMEEVLDKWLLVIAVVSILTVVTTHVVIHSIVVMVSDGWHVDQVHVEGAWRQ